MLRQLAYGALVALALFVLDSGKLIAETESPLGSAVNGSPPAPTLKALPEPSQMRRGAIVRQPDGSLGFVRQPDGSLDPVNQPDGSLDPVHQPDGSHDYSQGDTGVERISIDSTVRYQTINGFGTSTRVFDDPHVFENSDPETGRAATVLSREQQDEILDRLYVDLGLTRLRPIYGVGGFELANDNDDPDVTDLAQFNFLWKRNDAQVELAKRARARGVKTIYPTALGFEKWIRRAPDPSAEAAEWILTRIRRWRELGVELPYYSVVNEPGLTGRRRGEIWSGVFIRDVIRVLGPKLRAEGFETLFVVPDDWGPEQAYERSKVILADEEARKYVGALAYHLYRGSRTDLENMKRLGLKYNKQIWMTEYSLFDSHYWKEFYNKNRTDFLDWAVLINDVFVNYNVSAVDYMFGFMGQWGEKTFPGAQFIVLKNDGQVYRGFQITKQYYVMGQFSRFIKPGAQRVKAETDRGSIRVSAFQNGTNLTLVVINMELVPRQVRFAFETGSLPAPTRFRAIRTTNRENWQELGEIPLSGDDSKVTLPPRSVTTFVGRVLGGQPSASKP